MKTKKKSEGLSEWEQGVLMAVSILIATHDQVVAGRRAARTRAVEGRLLTA